MNSSGKLKPAVVYITEEDQEPEISEDHTWRQILSQPSLQWGLTLHAWAKYARVAHKKFQDF